jgi:pyruvate formate-lyase activating enzyme-like uncharacterized protein
MAFGIRKEILIYDKMVSLSNRLRKGIKGGEETDKGATFKPIGKELSKGCLACKSAGWICIYLSYVCNRRCNFCPQDRSKETNNRFGGWDPWGDVPLIDIFKERIPSIMDDIKGISFSGGEPLMQLKKVATSNRRGPMSSVGIFKWLDVINSINWKKKPYLWIYTSGHLINEKNIDTLVGRGINEIRFNLAASNYSYQIMKNMDLARKKADYLSVEVPVLPWQLEKLLSSLKTLNDIGVDYINLHELFVTPFNRHYLQTNRLIDDTLLYTNDANNPNPVNMFYLPSINDIYMVISYIDENKLNLIYNDCSARNAVLQSHGHNYLRLKSMTKGFDFNTWEEYRASVGI